MYHVTYVPCKSSLCLYVCVFVCIFGHASWGRLLLRYMPIWDSARQCYSWEQIFSEELPLSYQKYTFSKRKFHKESKYVLRNNTRGILIFVYWPKCEILFPVIEVNIFHDNFFWGSSRQLMIMFSCRAHLYLYTNIILYEVHDYFVGDIFIHTYWKKYKK